MRTQQLLVVCAQYCTTSCLRVLRPRGMKVIFRHILTIISYLCFGAITFTASATCLICSRSTRPLDNFDLPPTTLHCAFHLSTRSRTANALCLSLFRHSGTHFQRTLDFPSRLRPLHHDSKSTFSNIALIGVRAYVRARVRVCVWCCTCLYLISLIQCVCGTCIFYILLYFCGL